MKYQWEFIYGIQSVTAEGNTPTEAVLNLLDAADRMWLAGDDTYTLKRDRDVVVGRVDTDEQGRVLAHTWRRA